MIEFYHKNFKSNYKIKVKQLIMDLGRLFHLEQIKLKRSTSVFLDEKYHDGISPEDWSKINDQYYTLDLNKGQLSKTLSKFKIKQEDAKNVKYSFIDTFAGCGGLSVGLSKAGFNPVLVNEIESKFLETYYFNHDLALDSYYCGDIKDLVDGEVVSNKSYEEIDLVAGGPPCQGFSMANRQRILDDPRNNLYQQFLRLLAKTRPKFFLMENVKGMMNKSEEILGNFKNALGEDYSMRMILLNAKNYGVPQNRERVFVIGTRLIEVNMDQLIKDILVHESNTKQFVLKDVLRGLPKLHPKKQKNIRGVENEKIGFKFTNPIDNHTDYSSFIGEKSEYLNNHTNRYNNDRDVEIFNRLPQGANSLHESIADIMPYSNRNHMFKDKYYKLNELEVSKTITSHMKFDCNMYIHPTQSRGLSPREAARVQTFPDDFVFMGSNNTWYAQIGNAVPVKLAEAIGKEIIKYL